MEAIYKLKEARHFLDKLKNLNKGSEKFIFNLSAFLTAWRSVIDIMLYDYIEKYFGFSREEYFKVRDFEIAAKVSGNQNAISFCKWWKKQINILNKNPLWAKRNITVHKGRPPIKINLFLQESIAMISGIAVSAAPGTSVSIETQWPGPKIEPPTAVVGRELHFDDFPTKDIIDVCEEGFLQVKDMVDEAEKKFGNNRE
jgi:hypothetical protein